MDANQLRDKDPKLTRSVYDDLKEFEPKETAADPAPAPDPAPQPTPTPETPAEEAEEEGEENGEETGEDEGGEETAEADPKSGKARVREAVDKKNEAQEEVRSLNDTIAQLTGLDQFGVNPNQNQPLVKPGQSVSPEDYQKHVVSTANQLVDLKIAYSRNLDRIKEEVRDSISEYPQLDKRQKEAFDKDLTSGVVTATEAYIKANPMGDVKKFIDTLMKPYNKAVQTAVNRQQTTIAKQASQTAPRPTKVVVAPKANQDESIEDMEARLGKVY